MEQRSETSEAATMWSAPADDQVLLDADCSPTKTCKNMVGISFDGFAEEPGADLAAAWRSTLEREGKISADGASLADLVLGSQAS